VGRETEECGERERERWSYEREEGWEGERQGGLGGGVSSVQLVEGRRNRGVCKHVGRGKGPFRRGEAKISRVIL